MIDVKALTKQYQYVEKEQGLKGSLAALFTRKKYKKTAVNNFSCKVEKGEFIGLIGPNGAGKTTLIKMLTGILHPTSGEISVFGYNPSKLDDEFKKRFSLVMGQKSQLWWDLPAKDSFMLNKEIYEIADTAFNKKLDFFIEFFNIRDLVNVQVRQLSLGERMKMELISCLLHDPEILFLDEPTIGLDAIAQKNIRQFLQEVNKLGVTILLTSHYIEDIKHLCKRVIVINQGQKVYDGALESILSRFQEYKVVTITFGEVTEVLINHNVKWIEKTPYKITIKIAKTDINKTLQKILFDYDVSDIKIEEEDISNIIEKIYNAGKKL